MNDLEILTIIAETVSLSSKEKVLRWSVLRPMPNVSNVHVHVQGVEYQTECPLTNGHVLYQRVHKYLNELKILTKIAETVSLSSKEKVLRWSVLRPMPMSFTREYVTVRNNVGHPHPQCYRHFYPLPSQKYFTFSVSALKC